MTTIESANKKIMEKISFVKLAFEQIQHLTRLLDEHHIPYKESLEPYWINLSAVDFDNLESEYVLSVIGALSNYYGCTNLNSRIEEMYCKEFYKILSSENFIPRIDEFIMKLRSVVVALVTEINKNSTVKKKITRKGGSATVTSSKPSTIDIIAASAAAKVTDETSPFYHIMEKIKRNIEQASSITVHVERTRTVIDICACGNRMNVMPALSEMICENPSCSAVRRLEGTAADEMEVGDLNGNKPKHADYSPNRHFNFWMDRIQGKENKSFTKDEIDRIERIIKRDSLDVMTIYLMREILKETKLTAYNDHAALLMKIVTGVSPPILSSVMMQKFSIKFNKIIAVLEMLKNPDGNRPYYPYFIYKIAEDEAILSENIHDLVTARMLRKLMTYIHLQSDETVRKNDMLYKEICDFARLKDLSTGNTEDRLVFRITSKINTL